MNIRNFQRWALIISALLLVYPINLYLDIFSGTDLYNNNLYATWLIITRIIFVFGLTSIYSAQHQIGRLGKFGVILMIIPPLVELSGGLSIFAEDWGYINIFYFLFSLPVLILYNSFPPTLLAFYLGYIIVGWQIIRTTQIPKWVGGALIVFGILTIASFFTWIFLPEGLPTAFYIAINLMAAVPLVKIGLQTIKNQKMQESLQKQGNEKNANTPIILDEASIPLPRDEDMPPQKKSGELAKIGWGLILFFIIVQLIFSNIPSNLFISYTPTETPTITPIPNTPIPFPTPNLTATIQAWEKPSSSPQLANLEETEAFIDSKDDMWFVFESSLVGYATRSPVQLSPDHAGGFQLYEVEVSEGSRVLWIHEECAPTQENLKETIKNLDIKFYINNEPILKDNFFNLEYEFIDGSPCFMYAALIKKWPAGEHILETRVVYKNNIQTNSGQRLAGLYVWNYLIEAGK